jgi:hypothetical protein
VGDGRLQGDVRDMRPSDRDSRTSLSLTLHRVKRELRAVVRCDLACAERATTIASKFDHPWTNGQVERMNRTIKKATVRLFYSETHDSRRTHLATFLDACNFAKRLKSLGGLTPFERICQLWTEQPERFRLNPLHPMATERLGVWRGMSDPIR